MSRDEGDDLKPRSSPTDEQLVRNWRGVLMAASLPVETLMKLLNCGENEAAAFRGNAIDDICRLRAMVGRVKNRGAGT